MNLRSRTPLLEGGKEAVSSECGKEALSSDSFICKWPGCGKWFMHSRSKTRHERLKHGFCKAPITQERTDIEKLQARKEAQKRYYYKRKAKKEKLEKAHQEEEEQMDKVLRSLVRAQKRKYSGFHKEWNVGRETSYVSDSEDEDYWC